MSQDRLWRDMDENVDYQHEFLFLAIHNDT